MLSGPHVIGTWDSPQLKDGVKLPSPLNLGQTQLMKCSGSDIMWLLGLGQKGPEIFYLLSLRFLLWRKSAVKS